MSTPIRVLFVCLGNICRSPSAENIFRHLLKSRGLDSLIECDSCGIGSWHVGEAPHPKALAAAKRRNIPMTGKARVIRERDAEMFDYVVPMDRSNLREVEQLFSHSKRKPRIELMLKFCRNRQRAEDCQYEVPDPFYGFLTGSIYGSDEEFDYVFDLLQDACEGLLDTIITEGSLPVEGPTKAVK
eukprot:jgi/Galph1/5091/GphlegSOOS_G3758.1